MGVLLAAHHVNGDLSHHKAAMLTSELLHLLLFLWDELREDGLEATVSRLTACLHREGGLGS